MMWTMDVSTNDPFVLYAQRRPDIYDRDPFNGEDELIYDQEDPDEEEEEDDDELEEDDDELDDDDEEEEDEDEEDDL
jgi:hypothetical protein